LIRYIINSENEKQSVVMDIDYYVSILEKISKLEERLRIYEGMEVVPLCKKLEDKVNVEYVLVERESNY